MTKQIIFRFLQRNSIPKNSQFPRKSLKLETKKCTFSTRYLEINILTEMKPKQKNKYIRMKGW